MHFLAEYGLFLVKSITIVLSILICVGGIIALSRKDEAQQSGKLKITHLNEALEEKESTLNEKLLSKKAYKSYKKAKKKQHKEESRDEQGRLFVLDFKGDVQASQVEDLRKITTAILSIAQPGKDEVMVRLESRGGLVSGYGLAASQLSRFKAARIPVTACVDSVAASGGYLMACVADKIVAAPFAIIGSIGVITSMPNFNKLLKKHDIDYEQFTAGEYKRTVTMFSETTDEARKKRQEQVDEIHTIFKDFVKTHRPQVALDKVATGEYWLASDTAELKLVDDLLTSDDFIWQRRNDKAIYTIQIEKTKSLVEKLCHKTEASLRQMWSHFSQII